MLCCWYYKLSNIVINYICWQSNSWHHSKSRSVVPLQFLWDPSWVPLVILQKKNRNRSRLHDRSWIDLIPWSTSHETMLSVCSKCNAEFVVLSCSESPADILAVIKWFGDATRHEGKSVLTWFMALSSCQHSMITYSSASNPNTIHRLILDAIDLIIINYRWVLLIASNLDSWCVWIAYHCAMQNSNIHEIIRSSKLPQL